jgi:hypothetical protein
MGRCKKSGDHPWEDLVKYGYKLSMKYKFLIILLLLLHTENQLQKSDNSYFFFPPHLWQLKTFKIT